MQCKKVDFNKMTITMDEVIKTYQSEFEKTDFVRICMKLFIKDNYFIS